MPFRLNRLAAEVSNALSDEYQARYGLDIPEWRVLATLGFRNDACSAQYISDCTRTHKSTISRAVTALLARQIVERVENAEDRREFRLRLTRKGRALYEELIPRLLRKEQEILVLPHRAASARISRRCSARSRRASISCRPARRRTRSRRIEYTSVIPGHARRTQNLAIPSLVASDHPGMTETRTPTDVLRDHREIILPDPASIASCRIVPISSAPRSLIPPSRASSSA